MYSKTARHLNKLKILSLYKHMNECFEKSSFEIFQFLEKEDLDNLKLANKFFCDLCECHFLLSNSFKGLENIIINTVSDHKPFKKSKFKEKYDFNKSMNEFFKGSEILTQRIQSGRKKSSLYK